MESLSIKSKRIKTFISYIILFLLILMTLSMTLKDFEFYKLTEILKFCNWGYFLYGLCLICLYIIVESYIFRILIKSLSGYDSCILGAKIANIGLYFSLITPFSSGSQPMQVYSLTKKGISLSTSMSIITNKTILYQFLVTIYCFLGFFLLKDNILSTSIKSLVLVGLIINTCSIIMGLFILLNPEFSKKIVRFVFKCLVKINIFTKYLPSLEKIELFIDEYSKSVLSFVKDKKAFIGCVLLTILELTIYFSITYFVCKIINTRTISYLELLFMQSILYIGASPIPTPGSIGANEIIFSSLYSLFIPRRYIKYAVFIYSILSYYIILLFSGIISLFLKNK